jgi:hypothetical protein
MKLHRHNIIVINLLLTVIKGYALLQLHMKQGIDKPVAHFTISR